MYSLFLEITVYTLLLYCYYFPFQSNEVLYIFRYQYLGETRNVLTYRFPLSLPMRLPFALQPSQFRHTEGRAVFRNAGNRSD